MFNKCCNGVIVQLQLLEVLANIDCNFTVYLESVGLNITVDYEWLFS